MTLENPAPPGDAHVAPEPSEILTRLAALQSRDERLVTDRRTALLLAASLARLARAYRRDRDRLLYANLGLQREIQVGATREQAAAAASATQADVLARQVVDLKAHNEALTAENTRLRNASSVAAAPVEPRRRWRR
jgi:hypothetical protein